MKVVTILPDSLPWVRLDRAFSQTYHLFFDSGDPIGRLLGVNGDELVVLSGDPVWYEGNIEEGLRAVVRLLRDNGINTYYSCHHSMVIEAENYEGSDMERVYNLLVDGGYDGFTIEIILVKAQGERLERRLLLEFHRCPVCDNVPTGFLYPEGG